MLWYSKRALVLQTSLIFIFENLNGVTPQGYHSYTSVSRHSHFILHFMVHIFLGTHRNQYLHKNSAVKYAGDHTLGYDWPACSGKERS